MAFAGAVATPSETRAPAVYRQFQFDEHARDAPARKCGSCCLSGSDMAIESEKFKDIDRRAFIPDCRIPALLP